MGRYPKVRPPLPPAHAALYERHYRENREGASVASSIAQRLEGWMHRTVAADARDQNPGSTLEIGAGTLNQLPYEPHTAPYDVVEPFTALYADSPLRDRVRTFYADIADVPASQTYERITSIATFEHVLDLPDMIASCVKHLSPSGTLRIAVPSEGTPLWACAWRLGTGVEFRLRHGLGYAPIMRHEHVNTAAEVEQLLSARFSRVERRVFGLARSLSLYQCFLCSEPSPFTR